MKGKSFWKICAGVFAIAVFYATAGIIAAYIILNAVAAHTGGATTIFGTWWQTVIFVLDVIFAGLLIGSVIMCFKKPAGTKENIGEIRDEKENI